MLFLFKNNDWFETIGILIAIILASTIGSFAEYGSEEAFNRLEEEASRTKANVYRKCNSGTIV